jgi:hypothetical protein
MIYIQIPIYTENNSKKINEFWEKNKTSRDMSFLLDPMTIYDLSNHQTKLNCFIKKMYIEDVIQRNIMMKRLVELLWTDDINYILNLRSLLRDNPYVSLSDSILFTWMKKNNEGAYILFKIFLSDYLKKVAINGSLSEKQIKDIIAEKISLMMFNYFVKL